jgi:hypothetical protein
MLQVPLEIAFHNIDSIPWAEEEIRARVAKLEKIYDRLVACRVRSTSVPAMPPAPSRR